MNKKREVFSLLLAATVLGSTIKARYDFNHKDDDTSVNSKVDNYVSVMSTPTTVGSIPTAEPTSTPVPTPVPTVEPTPMPTPEPTPSPYALNANAFLNGAVVLNDYQIDAYEKVHVYEGLYGAYSCDFTADDGSFYTFVIPDDYITFLPENFVEVDIEKQMVYLYQNGQIIYSSNVVTGKTDSPTDIGYFDIDGKYVDFTLTSTTPGDEYECPVKYWMPYNYGEGLHDASWRTYDEFANNQTYIYNGSHGCVNLPLDTAETIYNNVEVGTRVLVHK